MYRRIADPLAVATTVMALAACGSAGGGQAPAPDESTEPSSLSQSTVSGDVTVFAAASLTESFTTLGEGFMAAHPEATVTFNFGPSSGLAQQIISGAPADVFAAASPATMQMVVDTGDTTDEPKVFVSNTLQIAVPPGNPGGVIGLADFTDADLTIALCAVEVPCGAASEQVLAAAGLTAAPDTLETDVKAALSKVELDEVDAALVYRTDVITAGDGVEGIEFPEASEVVNDYVIAVLTEAPNSDAAHAFVAYVQSREGQQILADAGFNTP